MFPSQVGSAETVITGVIGVPQKLLTTGGVGATANARQFTVEAPLGVLIVKAGISMV